MIDRRAETTQTREPLANKRTLSRRVRYAILIGLLPGLSTAAIASAQTPESSKPSTTPTPTRITIPSSSVRDIESRMTAIGRELTEIDRESTDALRISSQNATAIAILRSDLNKVSRETPSHMYIIVTSLIGGAVGGYLVGPASRLIGRLLHHRGGGGGGGGGAAPHH